MKNVTFSEILTSGMNCKNITGRDLSKATGVTESLISYYKSGKRVPELSNFYKLTTGLDLDPGKCLDLMFNDEYMAESEG